MATMRAIQNPATQETAGMKCQPCDVTLGQGNCRTCKLTRLNAALVTLRQELAGTPEKLTDNQVAVREDWMKIATAYAAAYSAADQTPNDFLASIQQVWRTNRSLTLSQMRGVLNVIRHEARQNARQNAEQVTETASAVLAPVADGYYTVKFDDGTHVTLRLRTQNGKQFVGHLYGPINTSQYGTFGIVQGASYRLFKYDKRNGQSYRQVTAETFKRQIDALEILMGSQDVVKYGKAYAAASKRCYRCNRLLTEPESIESGIGPICAGRE